MFEFLHEAGWGIYPVLLFGGIAFALAVRHAVRPSRERQPLIAGFTIATLLAGGLGAVTGLQHSVAPLARVPDDLRWIFLIGMKEALNNVVAAFVITVLTVMCAMIGSYRLALGLALARSMGSPPHAE